jgi:hypothetical protein
MLSQVRKKLTAFLKQPFRRIFYGAGDQRFSMVTQPCFGRNADTAGLRPC